MTVVRDMSAGSGAAIRTLIGACDVTDAQSWVAYVKFTGGQPTNWLISRDNVSFGSPASTMSFGYEGGALLFYPGSTSGEAVPQDTWMLLAGVHKGAAGSNGVNFYAYDLEEKEFIFKKSVSGAVPTHSITPTRLQFGRWGNTEQFRGWYAAAALFDTAITEANFLELVAASSVEGDWIKQTPSGLWVFDQTTGQEVKDLTGNGADGTSEMQLGFASATVTVPVPLRKEEGGGEEEGENTVRVKAGGALVDGKRYIKHGGILVPV